MTKRKSILPFLLLLLAGVTTAMAENGMNSPYTRFGLGQLSFPELGASKAMAGTGIGLRGKNQINMLNAASYSTVDTLTFILDMGLSLQNTNFSENGVRRNARNTTFDYLAAQYRLHPGLGMTIAYLPYSSVGYDYKTTQKLFTDEDGTISTTNEYKGEGGLQQVTAGLGWKPLKWFSIGGNVNYYYGYLQHRVDNQYNVSAIDSRTKIYSAELNAVNYDLGAQFIFGGKKSQVAFGATYSPQRTISSRQPYAIDYVVSGATATSADTLRFANLCLPETFGAGLSYSSEHLTVAADVSLRRFGHTQFFGQQGADSYRASLGAQYTPTYNGHNFLKSMRYRAGFFYSTTYFNIDGIAGPAEYGASIGVGIPVINGWNQRCTVNLSGQYVRTQPSVPGMISENCLRLNIGVSFIEDWFKKWKVD